MTKALRALSPSLIVRYLLLVLLTLLLAAQIGGGLWTLSRIGPSSQVSLGISTARPLGGTIADLAVIRQDGGIAVGEVTPGSSAERAGIQKGDLVVALDGTRLNEHPEAAFRSRLRWKAGDSVEVHWKRGDEEHDARVDVQPGGGGQAWIRAGKAEIRMSPGAMNWFLHGPELLLAVPFLLIGTLIGFLRPRETIPFETALAFLVIGLYCFVEYLPGLAGWPLWLLGLSIAVTRLSLFLAPPLFLRTMAVFPNPSRAGSLYLRWEPIILVLFGLAAPVAVLSGVAEVYGWDLRWPGGAWWTEHKGSTESAVFLVLCAVGLVLWIAQRLETRGRPQVRQRIIESAWLAALLGALWEIYPPTRLAWRFLHPQGTVLPMLLLFLDFFVWILLIACLPVLYAYAVLAHRVFGVRVILRKGIRHLLLSRGVLVVEGLLLFLILEETIRHGQSRLAGSVPAVAGISGAASTAVIAGLRRANRPLMHRIDRQFFRESYDARRVLLSLGDGLSRLREKNDIVTRAGEAILTTLHPSRAAIFLKDPGKELASSVWESEHRTVPGAGAGDARPVEPGREAIGLGPLESGVPWADLFRRTERVEVEPPPASSAPFELLVAIRTSAGVAGGIALGAKLSEEPYSREDKELLVTVATHMGLALENAELLEVAKREAEQAKELDLARKVQENLFPRELPAQEGWEFAALCRPAKAVGGDYYDLFEIDPHRVAIALGDVSGKGLGPSLLMSNVHAVLRSRLAGDVAGPAAVMGQLNSHLYSSSSAEMYITLFLGILDTETGRLSYVNGGHNPGIVLGASGEVARLEEGGVIVGMMPGAPYREGEAVLEPGSLLVLFSDGVTEAVNGEGEMFEEERLLETLLSARSLDAGAILSSVLETVDRFAGGCEQADDISLVVIRRDEGAKG